MREACSQMDTKSSALSDAPPMRPPSTLTFRSNAPTVFVRTSGWLTMYFRVSSLKYSSRVLPLMTMFVVTVETNFYERYAHYFTYITQKGNFREIDDARKDLLHTLWFELRHIIEFQLVFTLVALAVGNYLLSWSGITYNQVNMYNVLLFGAFFTGLLQLVYILLVYFDYQKSVLSLSAVFFLSNLVLGLWGLYFGGTYSYGFTFFLAAALSFIWAFIKSRANFWAKRSFCMRRRVR